MSPLAEKALERATLARMVMSSDPVTVVAPVSLVKQAPAPVPPPAPIAATSAEPGHWDSRTADKFVVRLPDGMRAQIADRARADDRSMNSLVIKALRNELAGREEHAQMLEALALLRRELQEALAAVKGRA